MRRKKTENGQKKIFKKRNNEIGPKMVEEWDGETHFLPHKFIERSFEYEQFTKQLLDAGRGHQVPRKSAHCIQKNGTKYKKIKR